MGLYCYFAIKKVESVPEDVDGRPFPADRSVRPVAHVLEEVGQAV